MSDMEQNRKSQLNYQEDAVRTGNHLYLGNCSTAGHGVFTISYPEAVGKTLQFNLYLKHCNSQKKQNTSISVVIVPFRRVNKNGDPIFLLHFCNVHIMNAHYAKFQKKFDSRTISRELP